MDLKYVRERVEAGSVIISQDNFINKEAISWEDSHQIEGVY